MSSGSLTGGRVREGLNSLDGDPRRRENGPFSGASFSTASTSSRGIKEEEDVKADLREVYFLILHFLSSGPCRASAKMLQDELLQHDLLPRRYHPIYSRSKTNFPENHENSFPLEYAELTKRFCDIDGNHIVRLLDELLRNGSKSHEHNPHSLSIRNTSTLLGSGAFSLLPSRRKETKMKRNPMSRYPYWDLDQEKAIRFRELGEFSCYSHRSSRMKTSSYIICKPPLLLDRIEPVLTLRGHRNAVYCAIFDKTGLYVITGSDDRLVKIWSMELGLCLRSCRGHTGDITDLAVNQSNECIASASNDFTIRVWSLPDGFPISVLRGHTASVTALAFRPGFEHDFHLLSSSEDGTCRIWDIKDNMKCTIYSPEPQLPSSRTQNVASSSTVSSPASSILCCAFNACGSFFVTGSADKYARVWDARRKDNFGRPISEISILPGHENDVNYVQFSGCAVSIQSYQRESDSGKKERYKEVNPQDCIVTCSRDGSAIIWIPRLKKSHGKSNGWIKAYHLKVPHPPLEKMLPRSSTSRQRTTSSAIGVNMIVWSIDNHYVLAVIMDFRICVWNASDGSLVHSLKGHDKQTYVLDVHPTDPRIAMTAGYDGKVIVWDIWKGESIKQFVVCAFELVDGHFSPDGTSLIVSDSVGTIYFLSTGGCNKISKVETDQFFLGDYRNLVTDSEGNVLDQETQLPPHVRNLQDPFCDATLIPYGEPIQSTYQKRRLAALNMQYVPVITNLRIGNFEELIAPPLHPLPQDPTANINLANTNRILALDAENDRNAQAYRPHARLRNELERDGTANIESIGLNEISRDRGGQIHRRSRRRVRISLDEEVDIDTGSDYSVSEEEEEEDELEIEDEEVRERLNLDAEEYESSESEEGEASPEAREELPELVGEGERKSERYNSLDEEDGLGNEDHRMNEYPARLKTLLRNKKMDQKEKNEFYPSVSSHLTETPSGKGRGKLKREKHTMSSTDLRFSRRIKRMREKAGNSNESSDMDDRLEKSHVKKRHEKEDERVGSDKEYESEKLNRPRRRAAKEALEFFSNNQSDDSDNDDKNILNGSLKDETREPEQETNKKNGGVGENISAIDSDEENVLRRKRIKKGKRIVIDEDEGWNQGMMDEKAPSLPFDSFMDLHLKRKPRSKILLRSVRNKSPTFQPVASTSFTQPTDVGSEINGLNDTKLDFDVKNSDALGTVTDNLMEENVTELGSEQLAQERKGEGIYQDGEENEGKMMEIERGKIEGTNVENEENERVNLSSNSTGIHLDSYANVAKDGFKDNDIIAKDVGNGIELKDESILYDSNYPETIAHADNKLEHSLIDEDPTKSMNEKHQLKLTSEDIDKMELEGVKKTDIDGKSAFVYRETHVCDAVHYESTSYANGQGNNDYSSTFESKELQSQPIDSNEETGNHSQDLNDHHLCCSKDDDNRSHEENQVETMENTNYSIAECIDTNKESSNILGDPHFPVASVEHHSKDVEISEMNQSEFVCWNEKQVDDASLTHVNNVNAESNKMDALSNHLSLDVDSFKNESQANIGEFEKKMEMKEEDNRGVIEKSYEHLPPIADERNHSIENGRIRYEDEIEKENASENENEKVEYTLNLHQPHAGIKFKFKISKLRKDENQQPLYALKSNSSNELLDKIETTVDDKHDGEIKELSKEKYEKSEGIGETTENSELRESQMMNKESDLRDEVSDENSPEIRTNFAPMADTLETEEKGVDEDEDNIVIGNSIKDTVQNKLNSEVENENFSTRPTRKRKSFSYAPSQPQQHNNAHNPQNNKALTDASVEETKMISRISDKKKRRKRISINEMNENEEGMNLIEEESEEDEVDEWDDNSDEDADYGGERKKWRKTPASKKKDGKANGKLVTVQKKKTKKTFKPKSNLATPNGPFNSPNLSFPSPSIPNVDDMIENKNIDEDDSEKNFKKHYHLRTEEVRRKNQFYGMDEETESVHNTLNDKNGRKTRFKKGNLESVETPDEKRVEEDMVRRLRSSTAKERKSTYVEEETDKDVVLGKRTRKKPKYYGDDEYDEETVKKRESIQSANRWDYDGERKRTRRERIHERLNGTDIYQENNGEYKSTQANGNNHYSLRHHHSLPNPSNPSHRHSRQDRIIHSGDEKLVKQSTGDIHENGENDPHDEPTQYQDNIENTGNEHSALFSWLCPNKSISVSYLPQCGDDVVYLYEGHKSCWEICPSCQISEPSWDEFSPIEFCKVIDIEYILLPSPSLSSPTSACKTTLLFTNENSALYGKVMDVHLVDDNYADFLILKSKYDLAIQVDWRLNQRCKVCWKLGSDEAWFNGKICKISSSPSPWNKYLIRYSGSQKGEDTFHSAWELCTLDEDPPPFISLDSHVQNDCLTALNTFKRHHKSSPSWNVIEFPDTSSSFTDRIPFGLRLIEQRLSNYYYRTVEAIKHDLQTFVSSIEHASGLNSEGYSLAIKFQKKILNALK